jgi:3-deoxy-D-manno-octulosonic acid (KDO) 8-phosphate synthase
MIVTVEPGAEPADVQRALAGRGSWIRRLTAEDGVRFYLEPASARIMVEAHPDPGAALSDAAQALPLDEFAELAREIRSERSA